MDSVKEKLKALAAKKAEEFSMRPLTKAVAITGSVARDMVWEGSDVDLWVFTEDSEGFEDGRESGVYWEADIAPIRELNVDWSADKWLRPMPLGRAHETVFEALWGCQVVYDPTGQLTRVRQGIEARMSDPVWREARIVRYLSYGYGCLDALEFAPPLMAIVGARAVATDYGITSYRLRQGRLLTSMCRVPEMLAEFPRLQTLYNEVFGLTGKSGAEAFLAGLKDLPNDIQSAIKPDLELEIIPVFDKGCYDGGVRHMRQGMPRWFSPGAVQPILALESDLEQQKHRVLNQTKEILDLCQTGPD